MFGSRTTGLAAYIALGALLGCGGPDTVVLVVVEGQLGQPVHRFDVEATVGGDSRNLRVPEAPGAGIFLPTSFTLQIPRDRVGTLRVTVVAFDAAGTELARGMGMLLSIETGRSQELTVSLGGGADAGAPDAEPSPDAGTDAVDAPARDTPAPVDAPTPRDAAVDTRDASVDGDQDGPAEDASQDAAADGASDAASDARDATPDRTPDATDARLDAVTAG